MHFSKINFSKMQWCHMSVHIVVVSVALLCFRPTFPFSSFQPFLFIGGFDSNALCRSRRELLNAYLLAKFGFDTAENEPSKVCPSKCSSWASADGVAGRERALETERVQSLRLVRTTVPVLVGRTCALKSFDRNVAFHCLSAS